METILELRLILHTNECGRTAALTLSYVDADPEQEEEDAETHEDRRDEGDEEFLEDVTRELCRRHFITDTRVKAPTRN